MGKDSGARTCGIVVDARTRVPVDVPATLRECWDQSLDSRAGTSRKGDQPQYWTQGLFLFSGTPCCYFFNLADTLVCSVHCAFVEL